MKLLQCWDIGSDHPRHGRFANKLCQYLVLKGMQQRYGCRLRVAPWIGAELFELNDEIMAAPDAITDSSQDGWDQADIVTVPMFFEMPNCPWPRIDPQVVRETFRWKSQFDPIQVPVFDVVIHHRGGDFFSSNDWPQVPVKVMLAGVAAFGLDPERTVVVSPDHPLDQTVYPERLRHVYDFQVLVNALALFVYPRSTFSVIAGHFNVNTVYLPCHFINGPSGCAFTRR